MSQELKERPADARHRRSRADLPQPNRKPRRRLYEPPDAFRRVQAKRIALSNTGALTQAIENALRHSKFDSTGEISGEQLAEITGAVTREVIHTIFDESDGKSSLTLGHSRYGVNRYPMRPGDPLAQAKRRGAQTKRSLLEAEGGTLTAVEVAELLGLRRQSVDLRRKKGLLIGLSHERRGYRYPKWQFTDDGLVLEGLTSILTILKHQGPWEQAAYMLNRNQRLDGERPLDLLRSGQKKRLLEAASNYGEQSAI